LTLGSTHCVPTLHACIYRRSLARGHLALGLCRSQRATSAHRGCRGTAMPTEPSSSATHPRSFRWVPISLRHSTARLRHRKQSSWPRSCSATCCKETQAATDVAMEFLKRCVHCFSLLEITACYMWNANTYINRNVLFPSYLHAATSAVYGPLALNEVI
jgi:hypothetical protein